MDGYAPHSFNHTKNSAGWSLVEVLTVMAVTGILVTAGLWSAQSSLSTRYLEGTLRTLAGDIATCKAMAVKQGRRFRIVLPDGEQPSYEILREVLPAETGYDPDNPFQSFRSINPTPETTPSSIAFSLRTNYPRNTMTFQPRGTANPGRIQVMTRDENLKKQIVVAITGRVRFCTPGVDAGCSPL